ncbi:MAG: PEP-CTERM sorting domain-containing protein [Planctomycetota bacterium]
MLSLAVGSQASVAGNAGEAQWSFEPIITEFTTTITVDSVSQAFLSTEALTPGVTLELIAPAVPFSAAQLGPGTQVGELLTSNFITGQESITATFDSEGTYDFLARWNVLGGQESSANFTITVIPEPASLALVGLGGLAIATRRRRA